VGDHEGTLAGEARTARAVDFPALVEEYQHKLFNVVLRMTGNQDDALDIVQDVFLKAYRSLRDFKGQASVYTWLYRIAVNTALSFRRSAATQMARSSISIDDNPRGDDDSKRDVPDESYEASSSVQQKEAKARISQAIAELDAELRAVVVLRDIEGLPYEEIAKILEVPKGTVKSRLHRGRLELRDKLREFL
jgi:RNA polymerase sigma-70 factor (ECF subfamily)